jgi:hypothetical protein
MADLSQRVRDAVIVVCYERAADMEWETLSHRQRSEVYDKWVDDPEIGGPLLGFLSRERARVWLKDVPMKEYSRAVSGVGPYARFASMRLPGPASLATQTLGDGWAVEPGSLRTKPNRVGIVNAGVRRLMLWGPPRALPDLLWAAMVARIDAHADPVIVLTSTRAQSLSSTERLRHEALAGLAGIQVCHTTVTPTRTRPDTTARVDLPGR